MRSFLKLLLVVLACGSRLRAAGPTAKSLWAENDVNLDTNQASPFWRMAPPVYLDSDAHGHRVPRYRTDFKDIKHYKEFEVSPQGEWIDLDIDLHKPHHEEGWKWNSGFNVSARIDRAAHVWYAAMTIPYSAIDTRQAAVGNILRINLFRSQGPPANRHEITWQAPMADTFHVPERFGLLQLAKNK